MGASESLLESNPSCRILSHLQTSKEKVISEMWLVKMNTGRCINANGGIPFSHIDSICLHCSG